MATKLTQSLATKLAETSPPGSIYYDEEVSGLRMVVGSKSSSWKQVGRINNSSGLYVTVTIGRVDEMSLKTARTRAVEIRQQLANGIDPRRPKSQVPTVQAALEHYIAMNQGNLQPSTLADYRRSVVGPLKSILKLPMSAIDRSLCRSLHEKLSAKHGPVAANTSLRTLRMIYNDVLRDHELPPNPVSLAVRFNVERPRDWAIPDAEMPKMWAELDALEDPIVRTCWMLLVFTGLRSTNARTARWEALDLDIGVLTIPRTKGGRVFRCPLPRFMLQQLEALREHTKPLASPWMFPATTTRTGHISVLRSDRGFRHQPHSLRHSFRQHALESGVSFEDSLYLLDHFSPHVSHRYVTRANLTGHLRVAQEKVAARILSFRGKPTPL
ncbi:MAG: tyrosine-type recombinase/integrase [Rhodobacteraceae bacterium]|nr:tyrosine-type recombinase/integrase [Paracoccaceae bacterium]